MKPVYGSNSVQAKVAFVSVFPDDHIPSLVAKSKALARPLLSSGISPGANINGATKNDTRKNDEM